MENITENQEAQREVILRSAADLFWRLGLKKTTMSDIARAAGLKKPSLYYYFSSKDEIISAVVKRQSRELISIMEKAAAIEGSTLDRFTAFVSARYNAFKQKKSEFDFSVDELFEAGPLLKHARNEAVELEIKALSRLLEQEIERGEIELDDPVLFARIAIASLQGIDESFWRYGLEDQIETGIGLMVKVFYKGVRKECGE